MRWNLFILFCALTALACSEPRPSRNKSGVENTPVGRVKKLNGQGTANAVRGSEAPRPLDSGAQLFADDAITTAGDVVVDIHIFKNNADLLLSQAQGRKLAETAAWSADKAERKSPLFIDRGNKDETPNPGAAAADAGPASADAGPASADAGPASADAGPASADAGPSAPVPDAAPIPGKLR